MNSHVQESYILREYFKNFIPNDKDLQLVSNKINKINREHIFSYIINNNKEIYKLISDNYSNECEWIDRITDKVNQVSGGTCAPKPLAKDEPFSWITINNILLNNYNKLQQYSNDIIAKSNIISANRKKLKQNEEYIEELISENEMHLNNLKESDIVIEKALNETEKNILKFVDSKGWFAGNADYPIKEIKRILINFNTDNSLSQNEIGEMKRIINVWKGQWMEDESRTKNNVVYYICKIMYNMILLKYEAVHSGKEENVIQKEEQDILTYKRLSIKLKEKNKFFENIKQGILRKYKNKSIVGGEDTLKEEELGSGDTTGDDNNDSINEWKTNLWTLEKNYIYLLKGLSRTMWNPKLILKKYQRELNINSKQENNVMK